MASPSTWTRGSPLAPTVMGVCPPPGWPDASLGAAVRQSKERREASDRSEPPDITRCREGVRGIGCPLDARRNSCSSARASLHKDGMKYRPQFLSPLIVASTIAAVGCGTLHRGAKFTSAGAADPRADAQVQDRFNEARGEPLSADAV